MDTKKLATLLEAVRTGSLKKAAEKLNYTQSGLIYLVNSLESELGVNLLNRTTKGITLTEEGKILEPIVRKIVDSEQEMFDIIEGIRNDGTGKLRIGSYPIYACYCLPAAIKKYVEDNQEKDISIKVATGKEMTDLIVEDEVDLAICEKSIYEDADFTPLFEYELYAAIPQSFGMKLKGGQRVSMESLLNYPILSSSYNQFDKEVEKLLEDNNAYKISVSSADGSALLNLVDQGLGVGFMSELYVNECPKFVDMVPLDPPIMKQLGVVVKHEKRRNAAIRSFVPYLDGYAEHA